jgi:glyoxylase-like metal-dependent hydrolase (beta-lactamase superfamily II)
LGAGGLGSGLVERIPVPLPIKSLGHVNAYLIRTSEGLALVDPGMHYAPSLLALLKALRDRGVDPSRIAYVAATHFHVDHLTASAVLNRALSIPVYMPKGDLEHVLGYPGGVEGFIKDTLRLFTSHGMPKSEAETIVKYHPALRAADAYEVIAGIAEPLRPGDRLPGTCFTAVEAPGHTPGHLVYHDGRILLAGDSILPGITPHITLHHEDTNPLADYLETLRRIESLNASTAYPGHRDPIPNPAARARELIEHHEERLREVLDAVKSKGKATAYDVARKVKWRVRYTSWEEYPPPERFFAMGETLAHLRLLEAKGVVEKVEEGRVIYWRPV